MRRVFANNLKSDDILVREDAENKLKKFNEIYLDDAKGATDYVIISSLKFLSKIHFDHFGKQCYVLIDEYDTPIHCAMQVGIKDTEKKRKFSKLKMFVYSILRSVLKDNDRNLKKGLITGISGIVKCSAFSGLNNVQSKRFLDNHVFVNYYGFTKDEVEKLLTDFNLTIYQTMVKDWYDGYVVNGGNLCIYNPWSIVIFIKTKIFDNYWVQSGHLENIKRIFSIESIKNIIYELLHGQTLRFYKELKTDFSIEDFKVLENILNVKNRVTEEMTEDHVLLFFSYIFELGYLSYSIKTDEYKIPNNEIKEEFKRNIIEFHFSLYKLSYEDLNDAIESLNELISDTNEIDSTNLERCLIKFLKPIEIKNFKIDESGVHGNEDIFHSIFNIIVIQSIANKVGSE